MKKIDSAMHYVLLDLKIRLAEISWHDDVGQICYISLCKINST